MGNVCTCMLPTAAPGLNDVAVTDLFRRFQDITLAFNEYRNKTNAAISELQEKVEQLEARPLNTSCFSEASRFDPPVRVLHIERSNAEDWGIRIVSGKTEKSLYVGSILKGSHADKDKQLRLGDRIVTINTADTTELTVHDAHELLNHCGRTCHIGIQRALANDIRRAKESLRLSRSPTASSYASTNVSRAPSVNTKTRPNIENGDVIATQPDSQDTAELSLPETPLRPRSHEKPRARSPFRNAQYFPRSGSNESQLLSTWLSDAPQWKPGKLVKKEPEMVEVADDMIEGDDNKRHSLPIHLSTAVSPGSKSISAVSSGNVSLVVDPEDKAAEITNNHSNNASPLDASSLNVSPINVNSIRSENLHGGDDVNIPPKTCGSDRLTFRPVGITDSARPVNKSLGGRIVESCDNGGGTFVVPARPSFAESEHNFMFGTGSSNENFLQSVLDEIQWCNNDQPESMTSPAATDVVANVSNDDFPMSHQMTIPDNTSPGGNPNAGGLSPTPRKLSFHMHRTASPLPSPQALRKVPGESVNQLSTTDA